MTIIEPKLAATVVVLRDTSDSPEVLLLQRSSKLSFHGGEWVFPGGRVDDIDFDDGQSDELEAARRAACRETKEEASIQIDKSQLLPIAHWTTPVIFPKRFATWFFLAKTETSNVRVDGSEIESAMWIAPKQALLMRERGEIALPPPTFITLIWLMKHSSVEQMFHYFRGKEIEYFLPKIYPHEEGSIHALFGDASFEADDPNLPGPRHRITAKGHHWVYERDDKDD